MVRFLWVTLLLLVPSVFGRAPFLSPLKPWLIRHGVSEAIVALAFTVGSIIGSFINPAFVCFLGRTFKLTNAFRIVYGLFILGFVSFLIAGNVPCAHILPLGIGYCIVRCCGQGLLHAFVRAYAAQQYNDRVCAWVASWHSLINLLPSALLYLLAACKLLERWDGVLLIQVLVLVCFIVLTPRHLPCLHSLDVRSIAEFRNFFHQASFVFKMGVLFLALQNFHATATIFHLSNFAHEQGVLFERMLKIFFPMSLLGVLLTPLVARLYARAQLMTTFGCFMVCLIGVSGGIIHLNAFGLYVWMVMDAFGWAFHRVLAYALVARVLPPEQQALGYATLAAVVTLCSALGPLVYSLGFRMLGAYQTVGCWMFWLNVVLTVWLVSIGRKYVQERSLAAG